MKMREDPEIPKFAYTFTLEKYGKAIVILNLFYHELQVPGEDRTQDRKFARIVFERGKAEELAKLLSIFLNVQNEDTLFPESSINEIEGIIRSLPHKNNQED